MYTVTEILLEESNPVDAVIPWIIIFNTVEEAVNAIENELSEFCEEVDIDGEPDYSLVHDFKLWKSFADLTAQTIIVDCCDFQAYYITKCEVEKPYDPKVPQIITTVEAAKTFITALYDEGLLYHFDDDAYDCLNDHDLSREQLGDIQDNVDQLFEVDYAGSNYSDCFDISLEVQGIPLNFDNADN